MEYINLKNLKIESTQPDDKIEACMTMVSYDDLKSMVEQFPAMEAAVKKVVDTIDRPSRPHRFEFEVISTESLDEDAFESAVKLITAAFFGVIVGDKGRKRERRLDVPENLKTLNCNMSLLKCAINYQTVVDKFQLEIFSGDLRFILVGGYDE
jgi:hypothetical protein